MRQFPRSDRVCECRSVRPKRMRELRKECRTSVGSPELYLSERLMRLKVSVGSEVAVLGGCRSQHRPRRGQLPPLCLAPSAMSCVLRNAHAKRCCHLPPLQRGYAFEDGAIPALLSVCPASLVPGDVPLGPRRLISPRPRRPPGLRRRSGSVSIPPTY